SAGLQRHIELDGVADANDDSLSHHRLEAFQLRLDRILARVEMDDAVEAFGVGDHHGGDVGLHVGGGDGDAREHAAAAVGDGSGDAAAKVLGYRGAGNDKDREGGTEQAGS